MYYSTKPSVMHYLVALALTVGRYQLVLAANDWKIPCVQGQCSSSVIWHLSFPSFKRFHGFLSLQRLETGKPGNPHIKPNLCIRSLLTSYDMVKYNLIPPDKLMGVMVDVMIDKKGVISVQRSVVIEVLWDV